MDITLDPEFRAQVIRQIAERQFKVRTGTHCTDVIYCLNKAVIRKSLPEVPPTDSEILLFSLGHATQAWLTNKLEDDAEMELDGLIVTPDSTYVDLIPWELKASYESNKREPHISWIRQILCQCRVRGVTSAKLTRLEIMGDWGWVYSKGYAKQESEHPTLTAWNLQFTQAEVDGNWRIMLERKALLEDMLREGILYEPAVALMSGQEYECETKTKVCPQREICERGEL